jgi:hypothetical protein
MKALLGLVFLLLVPLAECDLTSVIAELPTCAVRNAQLEEESNS